MTISWYSVSLAHNLQSYIVMTHFAQPRAHNFFLGGGKKAGHFLKVDEGLSSFKKKNNFEMTFLYNPLEMIKHQHNIFLTVLITTRGLTLCLQVFTMSLSATSSSALSSSHLMLCLFNNFPYSRFLSVHISFQSPSCLYCLTFPVSLLFVWTFDADRLRPFCS